MYEFIHEYAVLLVILCQLSSFLILSSLARSNYDPMDSWGIEQWAIMIVAALFPPITVIVVFLEICGSLYSKWDDIRESLTKERQLRFIPENFKLSDLLDVKEANKEYDSDTTR